MFGKIRTLGERLLHGKLLESLFMIEKYASRATRPPPMDTKPIKLDGGTCWHIEAERQRISGDVCFPFSESGVAWGGGGARVEAEMKTVTRRKAFLC